ncbi:MAG: hypothetical protein Tsb0026_03260 [Sulfuricaulis sp.]
MHKDGDKQLKLLLIEDSKDDAELLLAELRRGGFVPDAKRIETPEEMRASLQESHWDLIVADYTMPRFSATAALRLLRSTGMDLPFIIVSGTIGEATAVAAMKAGAHDYVTKDNLARVVPAIRRELREAAVRRERNAAEEQIMHMAYHDSLTGLPNRLLLLDRLKQAMFEADRSRRLVAVLLLDLDRFKTINDRLGHGGGDELLKHVAERLKECIRGGDTLARFGGDEFAIVLPDLIEPDNVTLVANKILERLSQFFQVGEHEMYTAASIGISVYPHDARHLEDLLKDAEAAMYAAKQGGRNTYRFFTHGMRTRAMENMTLEAGLRKALDRNEFELRYQPIVDLRSGRVKSVEALLHWNHPDRGLLKPEVFIALAEETGLMAPVGEWMLRTLCSQALVWHGRGIGPVRLSFNISPLQFNSPGFYSQITRAFVRDDLPATWFGLELTETGIMQQPELAAKALAELSDQGIWIGIDGFGTGYSSLGYLRKFPVDAVKIDISFVRGIPANRGDAAIVEAMVNMAHGLGMEVVAEGVETTEQLKYLRDRGCNAAQGPLFGSPLTAQHCEAAFNDDWRHYLVPSLQAISTD